MQGLTRNILSLSAQNLLLYFLLFYRNIEKLNFFKPITLIKFICSYKVQNSMFNCFIKLFFVFLIYFSQIAKRKKMAGFASTIAIYQLSTDIITTLARQKFYNTVGQMLHLINFLSQIQKVLI